MKVSIDTAQDSREDIKKAIRLLTALVEGNVYSNDPDSRNIFENPLPSSGSVENSLNSNPTESPNILGMFDNPKSIVKPEEKKEDKPNIEFY